MQLITVQSNIQAPVQKVWDFFTNPQHVINWNFAMPEWHCPSATNQLEVGGEFHYTMAARDNSMSFDFWGTYQKIEKEKGFDGVWEFLNCGPIEQGNEAYYKTLEKLTGITKINYNEKVWELINNEK